MRGFGSSSLSHGKFRWSFDLLAQDVLAVADAAEARSFHLVGESIGGTAAIAVALGASNRVLSLALSNAAARGDRINNARSWRSIVAQEGQAVWARKMMDWRFHHGALRPEIYSWYLQVHETCSIDTTLSLVDLLLESDFTQQLPGIAVPVLLMCPDASPFIPVELMMAMLGKLPGAEMRVFAHSKHGLPLSHGAVCAQVLEQFLVRRCA